MDTRQINTDLWLVVHIPKTAGTSFRIALEKYFGKSRVVRDYGPDAKVTSPLVRRYIYGDEDPNGPEKLVAALAEGPARVLVGHFPLKKYARFFDPGKVIAFVRDPLIRICSEYVHRLGDRTFDGTTQAFFCKPDICNQQSLMLEGLSDRAIVGLTENYVESLRKINAVTHWNLSVRKRNVGRRGGGKKLAESLSAQDVELFNKTNNKDLEFYRETKRRFEALTIPEAEKTR